MDAFDWFMATSYFSALQRDSEIILFGELARKDLLKKMDTGEELRILSIDYYLRISFLRLYVMYPWLVSGIIRKLRCMALNVSSASKVCIEKKSTDRDGENNP